MLAMSVVMVFVSNVCWWMEQIGCNCLLPVAVVVEVVLTLL